MNDSCSIPLSDAEMTAAAGRSLVHTLYGQPVTILLSGELGSGKTTFLKGFASELGIEDEIISPTFALEQRYRTPSKAELIHIDLFRLTPAQARELVASTEDHNGIRCIEWPERLETDLEQAFPSAIRLHFEEEGTGRRLTAIFRDVPLPTESQIRQWQEDLSLPDNVLLHCNTVADLCGRIADLFTKRATIIRGTMVRRAGRAHDLLRFIDFRNSAAPEGFAFSLEAQEHWNLWREKYAGLRHEEAAFRFLSERGYSALASIVAVHGLTLPSRSRSSIEQKVLFYADKRVIGDRVASLDERFEDFTERYGKGRESDQAILWHEEAKALERELFPEGPPT